MTSTASFLCGPLTERHEMTQVTFKKTAAMMEATIKVGVNLPTTRSLIAEVNTRAFFVPTLEFSC